MRQDHRRGKQRRRDGRSDTSRHRSVDTVQGRSCIRGKAVRAEPISALYEQGRIHHIGSFPDLEDQMCTFTSDGMAGTHDDRVDALVWCITELMLDGAVADSLAWLDFIRDFSAAERAVSAGAAPKKLAVEAVEPKAIKMKGAPHAQHYVNTRRYAADEAGSLRDVHPDDIAALEKSGLALIQPEQEKQT